MSRRSENFKGDFLNILKKAASRIFLPLLADSLDLTK